jgi:hypothetical protein
MLVGFIIEKHFSPPQQSHNRIYCRVAGNLSLSKASNAGMDVPQDLAQKAGLFIAQLQI